MPDPTDLGGILSDRRRWAQIYNEFTSYAGSDASGEIPALAAAIAGSSPPAGAAPASPAPAVAAATSASLAAGDPSSTRSNATFDSKISLSTLFCSAPLPTTRARRGAQPPPPPNPPLAAAEIRASTSSALLINVASRLI